MTQEKGILEALQDGERLTPGDALKRFGCMRLAARVYDLRKLGHKIAEQMIEVDTRSGTAMVAEYRIDEDQMGLW